MGAGPLPPGVAAEGYLARVEALAPGLIQGFYLVGSIALGGFRPGRSDIDFVATLADTRDADATAVLRRAHRAACLVGVARAVAFRSWPLVCNGCFLAEQSDLAQPPASVSPVAAQVAEKFVPGGRFDVNPVTWWTLAHRGIAVRGPEPGGVPVHLDDAELRAWTAANLDTYWRAWAQAITGNGPRAWTAAHRQLSVRRLAACGVLGTARMHATITTGQVISKEEAGEYALARFEPSWHPVIQDALAYWRGQPLHPRRATRALRRQTADFVLHVIELASAAR